MNLFILKKNDIQEYYTSIVYNIPKYSEKMVLGTKYQNQDFINYISQIYWHDVFYDSDLDYDIYLNSVMGVGLVEKF